MVKKIMFYGKELTVAQIRKKGYCNYKYKGVSTKNIEKKLKDKKRTLKKIKTWYPKDKHAGFYVEFNVDELGNELRCRKKMGINKKSRRR